MNFTLRPYQTNAASLLRGCILEHRKDNARFSPILCLPTGAGKTVTFSYLAEQAQRKGSRVGIVCHRKELVNQARDTMKAYGLNPLMLSFGMVQTYVRSPEKIPEMDLCIIDECHIGNFRKFIDLLPPSVLVIGATATPIGASKKKPLNQVFSDVVCPVQIGELINDGYLSSPVYHIWEVDESKLVKDFTGEFSEASQAKVFSLENLKQAFDRRIGKTIIFCSSITQAQAAFDMLNDGGQLFLVHSKMSESDRDKTVSLFKATADATIINCGILTAGFDDPSIETVIVYRATTSMALWLQMVGRGSRIIKGIKSRFYIFDMGNNRARLLAWEVDRDWKALFDLQGKKLTDKAAPMKKCVECEAVIYASMRVCPYCQAEQPIKTKEAITADTIRIIDAYSELPTHLQKRYEEMTVPELIERAQYGSPQTGRPFKVGWVLANLRTKDNFEELVQQFAQIKGYKDGWVHRQLQ
jgi:superfamily II DNA or RNA helicase